MSDEKKPLDPVLDRILRALARMPDPAEPDPDVQPQPKKKLHRKERPSRVKWVIREG